IAAPTPEPSSFALTLSKPSASTWNVTRMRAAPATIGGMPRSPKRASERHSDTSSRPPRTPSAGHHRRDAAQLEARERAALGHQLALALHHVHGHRGLAVLEGGEVLRLGGG